MRVCACSSGRVKSSRANRTSKGAEKWLDVQEHKHGTAACIAYLKVQPQSQHSVPPLKMIWLKTQGKQIFAAWLMQSAANTDSLD